MSHLYPFIPMTTTFSCGTAIVSLSHEDGSIKVFPENADLGETTREFWKAVFNAFPGQKDDYIKASKEYKALEARLKVAESLHDVAVTQRNLAWEEAERWRALTLKSVSGTQS
jgi:uncharacterized protein YbaP (TraB family)